MSHTQVWAIGGELLQGGARSSNSLEAGTRDRKPFSAAPIEIGPPEVKKMYQRAVDRGTIPEPGEMLEALRERGGVRIYGCSTSVKVLQLSPQQLGQVDAVMGHASFMSIAEGGQLVVI